MSLHADALAVLRGWPAPDAEQERVRRGYVTHLERHPDGLDRACRPDHLTASTLILSADGSQVLLTLHAKAGAWFQMGGHCEPGDRTLAAAALREAVEESGIEHLELGPVPVQLDVHRVTFCGSAAGMGVGSPVRHLDVRFLAVAPAVSVHATSAESVDVRWWPVNALPSDEPSLHRLVALGRARLAQSTSSRVS